MPSARLAALSALFAWGCVAEFPEGDEQQGEDDAFVFADAEAFDASFDASPDSDTTPDAEPIAPDAAPDLDALPDAAPDQGAPRDAEPDVPDATPDAAPDVFERPDGPLDERCNLLDDDGDGMIDEGFSVGTACTVGVGVCRVDGVRVCLDAFTAGCGAAPLAPADEFCNGEDDDCDGAADEDFELEAPCVEGEGACARPGLTACDARGLASCDALPGEPADEICNAIDDDCDGEADEDFELGEPCFEGEGECEAVGARVCDDEGDAVCDAEPGEPADDTCNGLDDDCDGATDEGFDLGARCVVGDGECSAEGERVCDGPDAVRCNVRADAPDAERCNAVDDDCDGEVDEGFDVDAPCVEGVGLCATAGNVRCRDDGTSACDAVPPQPAEVDACDGFDDDCDGSIDEGYALDEPCEAGVGACAVAGVRICDGEGGARCDAEPLPAGEERCEGTDEDCDGQIDEGFEVGTLCAEGEGECRAEGTIVCDEDGAPTCDAESGEPADELCNGLDDDCDRAADEGFGLGAGCVVGVGACVRAGTLVCGDAGDAVCDAVPGEPADEVCNDVDDDCDGEIDDGFGVSEACTVGVGACARVGAVVCTAPDAAACDAEAGEPEDEERCNGVDDDCDGTVDEGRVCGPYVAGHCRAWLGFADNNSRNAGPHDAWDGCPAALNDNSGDVRCAGTRLDGRFRKLNPAGDINDDDWVAVAFTCEDEPEAQWVQSHCAIIIGWADNEGAPDNGVASWGGCPPDLVNNADARRCASSGYDGRWRAIDLTGGVDSNDEFGVAFVCDDPENPEWADRVSTEVEVILAFSDGDRIGGGGETWDRCPAQLIDDGSDNRCASSGGDEVFRHFRLDGRNATSNDAFGIALRARDP